MTTDDSQQLFLASQSVTLPGLYVNRDHPDHVEMHWESVDGRDLMILLPHDVCATLLNIIDSYGADHAQELLMTAVRVAHAAENQSEEVPVYNVAQFIQALKNDRAKLTNEEHVFLAQSYEHLKSKDWTRAQAAAFASTMLGRAIGIEAWRKRVDRWAEDQGLPAIGQTKRRRRNLSGR